MAVAALEPAPSPRKVPPTAGRVDSACRMELMTALQKYLDLMYDCDSSRFDEVFRPTAHLHGFRDGEMKVWSMEVYRDILKQRQSPKSQNAPREDEVLSVDFASPTMALVKVRVRIAAWLFVDYLTWHRENGQWQITSKGFHLESEEAAGGARHLRPEDRPSATTSADRRVPEA